MDRVRRLLAVTLYEGPRQTDRSTCGGLASPKGYRPVGYPVLRSNVRGARVRYDGHFASLRVRPADRAASGTRCIVGLNVWSTLRRVKHWAVLIDKVETKP